MAGIVEDGDGGILAILGKALKIADKLFLIAVVAGDRAEAEFREKVLDRLGIVFRIWRLAEMGVLALAHTQSNAPEGVGGVRQRNARQKRDSDQHRA